MAHQKPSDHVITGSVKCNTDMHKPHLRENGTDTWCTSIILELRSVGQGLYSPTVLKKILCLFLHYFVIRTDRQADSSIHPDFVWLGYNE